MSVAQPRAGVTSRPDASVVGRAYDDAAVDYDGHLIPARWMRRALWAHFGRIFARGDRVLDVGCGTGLDTLRLAEQGVKVTAIDASVGMIAQLHAKLRGRSFAPNVQTHTGDVVDVLRRLGGPYDGLVSSFAPLNTVDLAAFAPEAERLLRPRAPLVAQLLAPHHRSSLRTRVWTTFSGEANAQTDETVDIHGHRVAHRLLPRSLVYERYFAGAFRERRPSWLSPIMRLTSAGRFYVLDLERRGP